MNQRYFLQKILNIFKKLNMVFVKMINFPKTVQGNAGIVIFIFSILKTMKKALNGSKMIQIYYNNMKFNLNTESYSVIDQENALSKANLLNRLIKQKAMIDSLIPETKGVNL